MKQADVPEGGALADAEIQSKILLGNILAVEEKVVDRKVAAGFGDLLVHDGSFPSFFSLFMA